MCGSAPLLAFVRSCARRILGQPNPRCDDHPPARTRRRGLPRACRGFARDRRTSRSTTDGRGSCGDASSPPWTRHDARPLVEAAPGARDAVLSLAGDAAPALWLLLVRASWLLTFVLAGAIAHRLTLDLDRRLARCRRRGPRSRWRCCPTTSPRGRAWARPGCPSRWSSRSCSARSPPSCTAPSRLALALAGLAALVRPEVWPLLALYGLWRWRAEPALRPSIAAIAVAVPALWFGPGLFGGGAAARARAHVRGAARRSARRRGARRGGDDAADRGVAARAARRALRPRASRDAPRRRPCARAAGCRRVSPRAPAARARGRRACLGSRSSPRWRPAALPACSASWRRPPRSSRCSPGSGSRVLAWSARAAPAREWPPPRAMLAVAARGPRHAAARARGRVAARARTTTRRRRASTTACARSCARSGRADAAALRPAGDERRARAHRAVVGARAAAVAGRELRRAADEVGGVRRRAAGAPTRCAPPCAPTPDCSPRAASGASTRSTARRWQPPAPSRAARASRARSGRAARPARAPRGTRRRS